MKRVFWLMLPFFAVCAGLSWMAAWLPSARPARVPPAVPARPAPAPAGENPEDEPGIPADVRVGEIHRDPVAVVTNLQDGSMGAVSGWMEKLNNGEMTPLQVASNLILNLNDRSVEAVAPDVLRRVLPDEVPGLVAGKAKAGYSGGLFMKTASAERSFRTPAGRSITLKVMDTGSMKAVAGFAQELAGTADLVQENEAGVVRTRTFRGHALFEKYAESRRKASAHLFVRQRFIIEIEGRGIALEELQPVLDALRLNELPVPALPTTPAGP